MDISNNSLQKNIKVSVIIPIYNVENIIEETINGLKVQTLRDVEFILIDDGSTDKTYQITLGLTKSHTKFKVVHQKNGGPAAARNHGLRLAQGEYICFVDSDDLLSENALEIMYEAAIHHDADLVTGGTVRFNSKGKWFIKAHVEKGLMVPGVKNISSHPELFYSIGPCAKLYKRDLIDGIYFPEHIRFAEDQPFVLHAYVNAKKIFTVDSIVYYYRLREGENQSLTQGIKKSPVSILNDVLEMLRINDDNFKVITKNSVRLKAKYYERVMTHEIWPSLREAIKSRDSQLQTTALTNLHKWLLSLEDSLFDKVPAMRYFLIKGIIDHFRFLRIRSYRLYIHILKTVISKLSNQSLKAFEKNHEKVFKIAKASVDHNSIFPIYIFSKKKEIRKKYNVRRFENIFLKRIVFTVSKWSPLKKNKVVFATNKTDKLEGNLKAIYDYLYYNQIGWEKYLFLKKDRTFIQKCKQYFHLGNAKVILLDDYYNQLYHLKIRKGTEVVQTWHACGAFKKFGFSAQGYRDANSLSFEKGAHSIYTKVVTSSSNIAPHYAEAFNKEESQVLSLGVPRTDMFFDEDLIEYTKSRYLQKYPQLKSKKIMLYAPTFRGTPKERTKFNVKMDLEKMKKSLSKDYVLILKLHPSVKEGIEIPEHLSDFVLNLSNVKDVNELLLISDLLITDYSSVIFEFSLLKRPIIFFAYDLDYYLSERGFYYDYKKLVPGPIASSTNEIIENIKMGNFSRKKIDAFVRYFFDHLDGRSIERFTKTILEIK